MTLKEFLNTCNKKQLITIYQYTNKLVEVLAVEKLPYTIIEPIEDADVSHIATTQCSFGETVIEVTIHTKQYGYNGSTITVTPYDTGISWDACFKATSDQSRPLSDLYTNSIYTTLTTSSTSDTTSLEPYYCASDILTTAYANTTYTGDANTGTVVEKNEEPEVFEVKCSCCGKKFRTTDPKQDMCDKCMCELADDISVAFDY